MKIFARQLRRSPRGLQARQGLTILEVLMAIGVAIIGLFGVWALIPLAGQRTQNALLQDDKSALGRSAFREFEVRGARESDTWLMSAKRLSGGLPANRLVRVPETFMMGGKSFCIDPHLFAEQIAVSGASDSVMTFPSPSVMSTLPPRPSPPLPNPTMVRLTLLRSPASRLPVPLPNRNAGTPLPTFKSDPKNYTEMSLSQATLVFQGVDDIIVNRNEDETLPAVQQYLRNTPNQPISSTNPATRRASEGRISWMATLVPTNSSDADSYHLSVVIFNGRQVADPLTQQEFAYEVVRPTASVPSSTPGNGFPGAGFGGGEVVIKTPVGVEFQRNDWVMLARRVGNYFAWYRVVAVDEDKSDGVTYVTLTGQDWNTGGPNPQQDNVQTLLYYVKGVVAVYEKTVRLETSSLWKIE